MSILIKGMKMPKSLGVCVTIYPDGRVVNFHGSGQVEVVGTAVPVPPHGDLIERSAVNLTDFEIAMCDGNFREGMKMLLEKLENAPTIIPAEGE